MSKITELDNKYVAHTYARFPVELVSGKGSVFTDADGKEYIDLGSGIGVTAFGAGDEKWVEAVTAQLGKLQHTSNLYYTQPGALLAEALCSRTGMAKVFFSNSGAEANECAIKVARKWSASAKGDGCFKIVTLKNSFHGRTLTTLAATGQDVFHALYQPLTPGFESVEAENFAALDAALDGSAAGLLLEVVQGEGGVVALSSDYLAYAQKLCRERSIPLMIDEVQTGNGRTGSLYAYQQFGLEPDIVSTAKGLGGGLPIGATLMSERMKDVLGPSDHGSTYGANPVCCAGALSVIERLDDDFLAEVRAKSELIWKELEGAEGIESVTGLGLMVGIKTTRPAREVVNECIERGVLCLTAKDKVRLLPALNIPIEVLKNALDIIKTVAKETK